MIARCVSTRQGFRTAMRRTAIAMGTVGLALGSVFLTAPGQAMAAGTGQDGLPAPLQVLAPTGGQAVNNTGRNIALIVAGLLVLAVICFLILLLRRRRDDDDTATPGVVPPSANSESSATDEPGTPSNAGATRAEPSDPEEPSA